MKLLEDRILKDGNVLGENISKLTLSSLTKWTLTSCVRLERSLLKSSRMQASPRW